MKIKFKIIVYECQNQQCRYYEKPLKIKERILFGRVYFAQAQAFCAFCDWLLYLKGREIQ